ncbi:MAG: DUF2007 domain-containing protein [Saprospiraceae bacterium]
MDNLVTLKEYLTSFEAHLIKEQLGHEGIQCILKNEGVVNTHPLFSDAMGQIDIIVLEKDLARAKEIIE